MLYIIAPTQHKTRHVVRVISQLAISESNDIHEEWHFRTPLAIHLRRCHQKWEEGGEQRTQVGLGTDRQRAILLGEEGKRRGREREGSFVVVLVDKLPQVSFHTTSSALFTVSWISLRPGILSLFLSLFVCLASSFKCGVCFSNVCQCVMCVSVCRSGVM